MFAVLLKELRGKKGVTQGQLAKAIGVSPGNIGDWETGKSKPGYTALAALARFFEVPADHLLELDTSKGEGVRGVEAPSPVEQELLAAVRSLSEDRTKEVVNFALFLKSRIE